jgi:hypothetical protein
LAHTFGVLPEVADWHYCLCVVIHGDTEEKFLDGFVAGDKPTEEEATEYHSCTHSWVAGMMYVHDDDLDTVAETRAVICEDCDMKYGEETAEFIVRQFEVVEVIR